MDLSLSEELHLFSQELQRLSISNSPTRNRQTSWFCTAI